MIRDYARVSPEGELLDRSTREEADTPSPAAVAANKAKYLPVEHEDAPSYNPDTEVLVGPTETVEADRVVVGYTVRPKTTDEVDALRAIRRQAVSAAFATRTFAPIDYHVGGVVKSWDADAEARGRIAAVLQLMGAGAMATERAWTASGELAPTEVTQADLLGIAVAIASREDALFVTKKTKEAVLQALASAAEIAAFDPAAGWGD